MPLTKNANPILQNSPSALKAYFLASRPKTWIASLSPVLIGVSMAGWLNIPLFALTLLFSLLIQIGTNFANDYFDFIKGADNNFRNGPKRATLEGWIQPGAMKRAFILLFLAAMIVAIPLMIQAGLWSFFLALFCVSFGILYTGGPKPLGYIGAGEVLVFIFFGPIATCGSYFLQTGFVTMPVLIASFAPGLLSCSILIVNNLRDEKSDKQAGKNTLIARFGKKFGAFEYLFSIFLAVMIPPILVALYGAPPMLLTACIIELLAIPAINKVFSFRDPLEIMPLLPASGALLLIYTALFCTFAR